VLNANRSYFGRVTILMCNLRSKNTIILLVVHMAGITLYHVTSDSNCLKVREVRLGAYGKITRIVFFGNRCITVAAAHKRAGAYDQLCTGRTNCRRLNLFNSCGLQKNIR